MRKGREGRKEKRRGEGGRGGGEGGKGGRGRREGKGGPPLSEILNTPLSPSACFRFPIGCLALFWTTL